MPDWMHLLIALAIIIALVAIALPLTALWDRRITREFVARFRQVLKNQGYQVHEHREHVPSLKLDCLCVVSFAQPYAVKRKASSTQHFLRVLGGGYDAYDRSLILVTERSKPGVAPIHLIRRHRRRIASNLLLSIAEGDGDHFVRLDRNELNEWHHPAWTNAKCLLEIHADSSHIIVVGGFDGLYSKQPPAELFLKEAESVNAALSVDLAAGR